MNRILLAALFAASTFCAKAQMTKEYVGKTSIEGLKVINYTRLPQGERIIENDTVYYVDWLTREVVIEGDVFPIREVKKSGNSLEIRYGYHWTVAMILSYDKQGNCIAFKIEL
jgi:hypothetical protein